jgi:hypothetical protein
VRGRFPFATLMSLVAAALLAFSGELLWAGVFLAMGLVFGAVTWRSAR